VGGRAAEVVVLVVRGRSDGPVLLITSGIHGDEPDGTFAIHDFCRLIDARSLSGSVVALPACNEGALVSGTRRNPADGKDLARVFPGDPSGSVTEQVAFVVSSRFIAQADFLCDLHSAGAAYAAKPFVGYYLVGGDHEQRQHQAAVAFGAPFVWATAVQPGRSLGVAAESATPAIFAETGGMGLAREDDIVAYRRGLVRVASFLGMIEGPFPREAQLFVRDSSPEAGHLQLQHRVASSGLFRAEVELWQHVTQGATIGRLFGRDGEVLEKVAAEREGRIVMLRTQAAMAPGDSAGVIVPVRQG